MTNEEMLVQIASMIESVQDNVSAQIAEAKKDIVNEVKLIIENDVTRRIDALTDGYQLVHEKQWELEHRLERLEKIIEGMAS